MQKLILLIDDDKDFGILLKRNLELVGYYRVATATSGHEGIETAQSMNPDLILLDINMPGMNGLEVLEKLMLGKETSKIPVMMLTALDDDISKIKATNLCMKGYITKPIKFSALEAKIDEFFKYKDRGHSYNKEKYR